MEAWKDTINIIIGALFGIIPSFVLFYLSNKRKRRDEHYQDIKKALTEYFETFMYWYEIQMENESLDVDISNFNEYLTFPKALENTHKKVIALKYKIAFYLYDEELHDLLEKMETKAFELQMIVTSFTEQMVGKFQYTKIYESNKEWELASIEEKEANKIMKDFPEKVDALGGEIDDLLDAYVIKAREILYKDLNDILRPSKQKVKNDII